MDRCSRTGFILLMATVFILSFDLATGRAGWLPELSVLLLCGAVLREVWQKPGRLWPPPDWLLRAPLSWAVVIYLAIDLLSAIYAPDWMPVWQKYRVTAGLLVVAGGVLLFVKDSPRVDLVLRCLGWAGLASALYALLGVIWPGLYPHYYRLRLSPRQDYNMFATALMTGLICAGGALIYGAQKPSYRRIFGLVGLLIPAILLSGSRRTFLMLGPVATLLLWGLMDTGEGLRGALPFVLSGGLISGAILADDRWAPCLLALSGCLLLWRCLPVVGRPRRGYPATFAFVLALWCGMGLIGGRMLLEVADSHPLMGIQSAPSAETAALARYMAADMDGLFQKRAVLYRVAAEEARAYNPWQMLVGQGLGHQILLYSRDDPRVVALYPEATLRREGLSAHNMLLADFLDGGAIKLLAGIGLLCALGWELAYRLRQDTGRGVLYALALGLSVAGAMVSGRYGLLYDRNFVLLAALLLCERGFYHSEKAGTHVEQPAPP